MRTVPYTGGGAGKEQGKRRRFRAFLAHFLRVSVQRRSVFPSFTAATPVPSPDRCPPPVHPGRRLTVLGTICAQRLRANIPGDPVKRRDIAQVGNGSDD